MTTLQLYKVSIVPEITDETQNAHSLRSLCSHRRFLSDSLTTRSLFFVLRPPAQRLLLTLSYTIYFTYLVVPLLDAVAVDEAVDGRDDDGADGQHHGGAALLPPETFGVVGVLHVHVVREDVRCSRAPLTEKKSKNR